MLNTILDSVISGVKTFNDRLKEAQQNLSSTRTSKSPSVVNKNASKASENLIKKFSKSDDTSSDDFIKAKEQSMRDSQGVSDFSGSSYNGPGNVDREKTNSNMSQRNF